MTHKEALSKLMKYCAYQDRCQKEVRNKLYEIDAPKESIEDIICTLIEENFLNEERFAASYVRGKFYYKQWGRLKILQELKQREISAFCIKKALTEINEEDYLNAITDLIKKKISPTSKNLDFETKSKIANYLYQKGYENDLIWEAINSWEQST